MKKNKFFDYYFSNIYDESSKKIVYNSFKEKNFVKILDCKNYLITSKFDNKIKHNDKKLQLIFGEVKKLELGMINWFSGLSKELQQHLNDYAFYLYQVELNDFKINVEWTNYSNYMATFDTDDFDDVVEVNTKAKNPYDYMYGCIDKNLKDILFFYDSYFCLDDIYDSELGDFKEDVLNKIVHGNKIPFEREIIAKVIFYAVCESDDSLLDFNNGLFKLNSIAYERFVINGETIHLLLNKSFIEAFLGP